MNSPALLCSAWVDTVLAHSVSYSSGNRQAVGWEVHPRGEALSGHVCVSVSPWWWLDRTHVELVTREAPEAKQVTKGLEDRWNCKGPKWKHESSDTVQPWALSVVHSLSLYLVSSDNMGSSLLWEQKDRTPSERRGKSPVIHKNPWDGWVASPTQWTWVRASSERWWRGREVWHAVVHGVAKCQIRFSD